MKIEFNKEEKTLTIGEKVFEDVKWFYELKTTYKIEKENNKYDIFSKDNLENPIFEDVEWFYEYEKIYIIEKEDVTDIIDKEEFINNLNK